MVAELHSRLAVDCNPHSGLRSRCRTWGPYRPDLELEDTFDAKPHGSDLAFCRGDIGLSVTSSKTAPPRKPRRLAGHPPRTRFERRPAKVLFKKAIQACSPYAHIRHRHHQKVQVADSKRRGGQPQLPNRDLRLPGRTLAVANSAYTRAG